MKTHARVVIVGGGINGCSLLYHLTRLGWTDVVLVEKNELTSGSTWLAAGNVVQWTPNRCNSRLHQYSIALYQSLEAETGQETGWRTTGSLRLATTADRMDEYRHVLSKDHTLGIGCDLVSPAEARELFPFMEIDGLIGAMHHELDGHWRSSWNDDRACEGRPSGWRRDIPVQPRTGPVTDVRRRVGRPYRAG